MIFVIPEDGDILNEDQLLKLVPIIKKKLNNNIEIFDNKLIFKESDEISSIISILNLEIKEKVIVPQYMGNGPTIRHRIFNFQQIGENSVEVRYTQLGNINYDEAIKFLENN